MKQFKFCRICLVTDVNMYSLDFTSNESIGVIYSQLAQIRLTDRNQHVCFECVSLLQKYQMFKSKCLRAHNILSNILVTSKVLTKQIIQNIDRKKNNLESNLVISPIDLDEFIHDNSQTHCLALENYYQDNNFEIELKSEVTESHKENDLVTGLPKTHNFNEDCYKDTAKEFQLLEEPNIKKEAIDEQDSKKTKNCDTLSIETDTDNLLNVVSDPLDDSNNENVFLTSNDNIPNEIVESVTDKCKTNTTEKTNSKRRKKKTAVQSADDFSDNKLLSKRTKITKKVKKRLNKHSRLNLDFYDDYGTVVSLTPDDAKKELLSKKESENYKISPFKCDFCYKGYGAKATYDNHMKKHAVGNGDYECELCHLRFPSPVHLYRHNLSCHKRKFSCKLCPYICYSMGQAKTHIRLHKGKKYPCKDCGKIFSMPNTLFSHKRLKHLNDSVAESVCDLCGDIFSSAMGVFVHQEKLHRMDKNNKQGPKCEECNVHFTSEVAWKRHLVLSTRHIVVNGCKYCGESFTTVEELNSHKRKQHKDRCFTYKRTKLQLPGSCSLCQKWLMNYEEYKSHMSIEHPQSKETKILNKISSNIGKYVCEVCGRSFNKQCFLIYHQRIHTGERPYKCEDCGKTFPMAGALKEHQKAHKIKFRYNCDICSKVLASIGSLRNHMRIHVGIRPYKCTICDKSFFNMCERRVHIKYSHNKVPWPKKKNKKNIADNNEIHAEHNK